MTDFGIYIGRFQPFHNAHELTVKLILERVKKLIIVVGSDNQPRTTKNPWTSEERVEMISSCFGMEDLERIEFVLAKDYLYNNNLWMTCVQQQIEEITEGSKSVSLFGHEKDDSSFYLSMLSSNTKRQPITFVETLKLVFDYIDFTVPHVAIAEQTKEKIASLCATLIRNAYFTHDWDSCRNNLPAKVWEFLYDFAFNINGEETSAYALLKSEREHINKYKDIWKAAPFPPTFVTTDAVVVKSGHVLVVRRKALPGKGLLALPGGFLAQNETIESGCLRELREETRITVATDILRDAIVDKRVFDHPQRSFRGRTITHAFCIDLGHGQLPHVKGSDDADKAFWMSFADIARRTNEFFEDHASIIEHFIHRF